MTTVQRVHDLAEERELSISELSRMCDMNPATFRAAERRNSDFSFDTITRICGALHITLAEFFRPWDEEW